MRILFCGGGSVGHLAPSVAVWEAVQEKEPNAKCFFVCSGKREDHTFLQKNKLPHIALHAPKWQKSHALLFPFLFPFACLEAMVILLWFRPDVIFAKGGYVAVPIGMIAKFFGRPVVLHESDRVMGKANRLLVGTAKHLCIGTPQKEVANEDVMNSIKIPITATGNPVRERLLSGSKDGGKRVTGFSGKKPVLLAVGGSQGAQVLNEMVHAKLGELTDHCDVIHITGSGKSNPNVKHARYLQFEFIDEELEQYYALADLVVSRAGAGSIAELSALGKACVFVPLPGLANNHQEENAKFLEAAEAAVVLEQETLEETFVPTLVTLLGSKEALQHMGERIATFADPEAAHRIASIVVEIGKDCRHGGK